MFVEFKEWPPPYHHAIKTKRIFPVLGMGKNLVAIEANWHGSATPHEVKKGNAEAYVNPAYPEERYDRSVFGWFWFSKDKFIFHENLTNAEAVGFLHS